MDVNDVRLALRDSNFKSVSLSDKAVAHEDNGRTRYPAVADCSESLRPSVAQDCQAELGDDHVIDLVDGVVAPDDRRIGIGIVGPENNPVLNIRRRCGTSPGVLTKRAIIRPND